MPLLSPLKAVIFDCDGVLVDTEPLHYRAFQEVLQPLGMGHDYDRYLSCFIGFDDRDAFLEAFREVDRPIDSTGLQKLIEAKNRALLDLASQGISGFPGVLELVEGLRRKGMPLAVASGSLLREVEAFILALGIRDAFRVVVAADHVSRSKPSPETYLVALDRLKEAMGVEVLEPRACIAIEDTPAGIKSAKGAGLYAIGVAHSYPTDLLGDADYVVEDMTRLNVEKMIHLIERSFS